MKNEIKNLLAVFILVMVGMFGCAESTFAEVTGSAWGQEGGIWYMLSKKCGNTTSASKNDNYSIYVPKATQANNGTVSFYVGYNVLASKVVSFYLNIGGTSKASVSFKPDWTWSDETKTYNFSTDEGSPTSLTTVNVGWSGENTRSNKNYDVKIKVPPHIYCSSTNLNFQSLLPNTSKTLTIPLVSFLTSGNLTVRLTSCTLGGVDVKSQNVITSEAGSLVNGIQIASNNAVYSPYNQTLGAAALNALKIKFNPTTTGVLAANIEISDGTKTVNITVSGASEWQSLTFTDTEVLNTNVLSYDVPQIMGNNLTVTAPEGYFLNTSNDTAGWTKTLTGINGGSSTIFVKFQPTRVADFNTYISFGTNCRLNVNGKGINNATISKDFSTGIPASTNGNHYTLPGNFYSASTGKIFDATIADGNTDPNDDNVFMVQPRGLLFQKSHNNISASKGFRIGFYPKNYKQSYTSTFYLTAEGVTYAVPLSGTGHENYRDFTPRAVGSASSGSGDQIVDMTYFDCSNNITITAPKHFLLIKGTKSGDNYTWEDTWAKSFNAGQRAVFKIRFAPENSFTTRLVDSVVIHDNNESPSAYNYCYRVEAASASDAQPITFSTPTRVSDISSGFETFSLTDFIPSGDVSVEVINPSDATNFVVSATSGGTYNQTCTIPSNQTPKTFYVKFKPQSGGNHTETIRIKDNDTERTYDVTVTGYALNTFDTTKIGQSTTTKDIDLSGLSGALTLTSTNPTVFRVFTTDEASANTALGNTTNIPYSSTAHVKFYPEAAGDAVARITISDNNGHSIELPISGYGVQQSHTFGSEGAKIARGTVQFEEFELDNMTSKAGYTISANGKSYYVTQPQNGKFKVFFLPQGTTHYINYNVNIHDNSFATNEHDYKIVVNGYADAVETVNFGSVDARSKSSTTKQITLSGVENVPGLMIESDEMNSYLINNQAAAFVPSNGPHTVSFTPFHQGSYNSKNVYFYTMDADGNKTKYQLLNCNGTGLQVDLTSMIQWVNTTIETHELSTGMAIINNSTYSSYVRLVYSVTNGGFYDSENKPEGFEITPYEILAPVAGTSTVKATVEVIDGSTDFVGESSSNITATDSKVQKISYSSNIHYALKDGDISVEVYAYDSKNPSTHLPASFQIQNTDGKLTITENTAAYNLTTFTHTFIIHGVSIGNTTVNITATPPTGSEYSTATVTGIPVTVLLNANNCAGLFVLSNTSDRSFNNEGSGGTKDFALTGAPCRRFKATLTYSWGTPKLTIFDGTNTLANEQPGSSVLSKTINVDYTYTSKQRPTTLSVSLTGTSVDGDREFTINEFSQLSYFDVISNHPNESQIPFGNVTVGMESAVNETIRIDYSALHKPIELTLTDETNFTIVNKDAILGLVTSCSQFNQFDLIIKYNPKSVDHHTSTLKIKGYTTNANNQEEIKEYTYYLSGDGIKRTQIITWKNQPSYSMINLEAGSTLTLKAVSNQYRYETTTLMPVTFTLDDDGQGVATLQDSILTVAKAGAVRVIAHAAGDVYTDSATAQPFTINFTLEPQHIDWRTEDWSGSSSDTKTIYTNTTTRSVLRAYVKDSHGNDIAADPEFLITYENKCCGTDLIRIEKDTTDGKYYAYYNNQGTGRVKITAYRSGDATYSPMEEDDMKSMYLVIDRGNPIVVYSAEELQDIYLGDEIVLTRPSSTIDNPSFVEFDYVSGINSACTIQANNHVTLTKDPSSKTTTLKAIRSTQPGFIYIRADQPYNECFNEAASSSPVAFMVKKPDLVIEWNQTLNLYTGQYPDGGATYTLTARAKDTHNNVYPSNLVMSYDLLISNKGCSSVPDNQIAEIIDGVLHVYGGTSAILTITASQNGVTTEGYSNYNPAAAVVKNFAIEKLTPTSVTVTGPVGPLTYGTGPHTLTAQSTGDNYSSAQDENAAFTYSCAEEGVVASITGDQLTILKAGTITVTATQTQNCMVESASSEEYIINVSEASPDLQFTQEPTPIYFGDNSQKVIAESKSSPKSTGAVTYSSSDVSVATVDANTGIITPVAQGTFTVTASITGVTDYWTAQSVTSTTLTIKRANPSFGWATGKAPSDATFTNGLTEYIEATTNSNGAISYKVSPENSGASIDTVTGVLTISKAGTYTVTASVAKTDQYEYAEIFQTITISKGTPSLTISGITPMECYSTQEMTYSTDNFEATDDSITYTSDDPTVIRVIGDGPTIEAMSLGTTTIRATLAETTSWNSKMADVNITVKNGTLHFVGTIDDDWYKAGNWSPQTKVPTTKDSASIDAVCVIAANQDAATCMGLRFNNAGSLSVNADAVLDVLGPIKNSTASKLTLKANATNSATVLFTSDAPKATVECYIKGRLRPNDVPNKGKNNPAWQYRGFVGNSPTLSGWNVVMFKWNEATNNGSNGCWGSDPVYARSGGYTGTPWDGYCMATYDTLSEPKYLYTTELQPTATHEYALSYTDHGAKYPNRGVNLITNSWSAPIDMSSSDVAFSGNVEHTFYFYETRSHLAWEYDKTGSFTVYPQVSGEYIYAATGNELPASQSVLVKATGAGAKLTVNSGAFIHSASGQMHAPAVKEKVNILSVVMAIDTVQDKLYLLESENCSKEFDNGYDGTKIEESNIPQIFAANEFGNTAVNADKTILGQIIGYKATADKALCTVSFNTERLEGFSELYLLDRVAKRYTNILAGETYSFEGTKAGEKERFEIVGRREDGSEYVTSRDKMIEVVGKYALLSGFAGSDEAVIITDMNGKRLWTDKASNGPWFELPLLPKGVYVINCGETNCKFIVK